MADERERGDETRVSGEIPPEAVGDEAAAGEGGGPGDTAESPVLRPDDESSGEGTEIVFAREVENGDGGGAVAEEPAQTDEQPPVAVEQEQEQEQEPPPPPPPPAAEERVADEAPVQEAPVQEPPVQEAPYVAPPSDGGTSPADADRRASEETDAFAARPELYAAGAFVGGFVLAQALKYFFGEDDE